MDRALRAKSGAGLVETLLLLDDVDATLELCTGEDPQQHWVAAARGRVHFLAGELEVRMCATLWRVISGLEGPLQDSGWLGWRH